jgi:predicted  nucleic acid-binding Zn ribbon protein
MTLRDGKFYNGGQVVPLEFGNKEQIRLIQEAEKALTALSGDGLIVEPNIEEEITYSASYYFKCVCGNRVENHSTCRQCKRTYTVVYADKRHKKLLVKIKQS